MVESGVLLSALRHYAPEEAEAEAIQMINVYREFAEDVAAMPVVVGRKSRVESFAGANCTYTIEVMAAEGGGCRLHTTHQVLTVFVV